MTPTKGGDIRTCLSHLVSVPAPPLRPTELSRLRTSCGFLSIQQTFPEHPRPVPQPVGDGDLANRGREGTQSTSRSRLHSRGRSWPEVRDRAGAGAGWEPRGNQPASAPTPLPGAHHVVPSAPLLPGPAMLVSLLRVMGL